eukprot:CAMPEP_0198141320 /NCGR_PEP_ID=MMETSP1443-20131203/4356_1 /TAXON_ID=186043 /ORGANISM="Entomoneis sp., Strain CCMP2396" /LENGTH=90 /DNA_ID=CAMNT_0043804041 /DNA_START=1 /DNA_END=270 /DNA_ORIENTATION=+
MNYDINMVCHEESTPLDFAYDHASDDDDDFIVQFFVSIGGMTYEDLEDQNNGEVNLEPSNQSDRRCNMMEAAVLNGDVDVFDLLIDVLNY